MRSVAHLVGAKLIDRRARPRDHVVVVWCIYTMKVYRHKTDISLDIESVNNFCFIFPVNIFGVKHLKKIPRK